MTPAPFLVSTTLCGAEGVDTIGEALASIAPHVDAVIVILTAAHADQRRAVEAAAEAAIDSRAPLHFRLWAWRNDFGAARNAALDFAAETGATWCVWVDSDETIAHGEEIRPFLASRSEDKAAMMPHASGVYLQPRAIRLPCAARWSGRVHEAIPLIGPRFPTARFCDRPKTPEQMKAKRLRDIEALGLLIDNDANDPRWWYYLGDAEAGLAALTEDTKEDERARLLWGASLDFRKAVVLPGWDEQAAWAAYRAADILSALGKHDEAVNMCARGLARHAGIAELAWMASLASYRAGRHEQALYWSRLADVHGAPGLGSDGEALSRRTLFREPKGLTFGPAEVREHALRALGRHAEAEDARRLREARIGDVARLSGDLPEGDTL